MPPAIAYVTGTDDPLDPDPDLDLPLAADALAAAGLEPHVVRWDDPDVDWAAFTVVVVRSTWDYVPRRGEFLAWAHAVSAVTALHNPVEVLAASTDKHYLQGLAAAGVPVVQTHWLEPGEDTGALPHDGRYVVKPAVGAGARDALLSDDPGDRLAHARRLLAAGRSVLVQPYLESVEGEGELSVVLLDGGASHAVRKVPALVEGGHGDASGAVPLTDEMLAVVESVRRAKPGLERLLYARLDLLRDDTGRLVVLELELAEPLLFLGYADGAPERFAAAVAARCG